MWPQKRCITIDVAELCRHTSLHSSRRNKVATLEDEHLSALAELIHHDFPSMKTEMQKELQPYWSFRDEIAIIGGITIKGRIIIIPASPKKRQ